MTPEQEQEWIAYLGANAKQGIVPPPNPMRFLQGKGIQTMKEQAKKLRQLAEDGKLKDQPMADWLAKPFKKPVE
jgi:hypothetical protein